MRGDKYQIVLIALGVIATVFLAYFFYFEFNPEYKIFQRDYVALEEFRSQYTGEPPAAFNMEVKQIVFEREDKGPAAVDRCISCHVALQIEDFSPTKIAYDVNGNVIRDLDGNPVKIANENYIWGRLDKKIAELTDEQVIKQLIEQGEKGTVKERLGEAKRLAALKTAKIGDETYDVSKVLLMHPLIGKEVRPFEFHPLEEYGCTSCHSGNGRALTVDKAHGPVYDREYEIENMGPTPEFTERDIKNDPPFAHVFNHKPGDALLFQTTPILVGHLMQANCVQCHKQSAVALQGLAESADTLATKRKKLSDAILEGFKDEKAALISLLALKTQLQEYGYLKTLEQLEKKNNNPALTVKQRKAVIAQIDFLKNEHSQDKALEAIEKPGIEMLGSEQLLADFAASLQNAENPSTAVEQFLKDNRDAKDANGSLFVKWRTIDLEKELLRHVEDTQDSLNRAASDHASISAMASDIDWLTKNYHRGKQLFFSQACYACHRIAGLARGGVGPELTRTGENYPWFVKQSIVWPQADLPTSTMPNMVLDHVELEDLMTFLLAQKGPAKSVSQTDYKMAIQEWDAGRKIDLEKPIPPTEIHNLHYGMTVFATEGCAACHRLKGFESDVGFTIEKNGKPNFKQLQKEHAWFQKLFPEEIHGSALIRAVDKHSQEIDKRISGNVRQGSILEEINEKFPEDLESFYSNFRYASRAKNEEYKKLADAESDPKKKKEILDRLQQWKERIHRLLMIYIQEYGLGRLIGPRPNWSGVYRSDEWLMEHFRNPTNHVPKSIMPVFPFDETKFYALTSMLDAIGKTNRDGLRAVWQEEGFSPEKAYKIHCSQCHGDYLQGNGPVSTWIYPIPKNLRSAEFLRNLTRENVITSITHGVKGTPMPPWGETPKDKENYDGIPVLTAQEISQLVDWMFSSLPGGTVIKSSEDVPKWRYTTKDVLEELKREGNRLRGEEDKDKMPSSDGVDHSFLPDELLQLEKGERFYASLTPIVAASEEGYSDGIFEERPHPLAESQDPSYYIKKKYYTAGNIEAGQQFFAVNCAVCHGAEADGSGIRASVMAESKPRMLTNLDWLNSRDDLRLLRSIKYGVPGTAMTPWGDLTSSLQRLQLVIYIRSLSKDKESRETLAEKLYQAFEMEKMDVQDARVKEYGKLEQLSREYADAERAQRKALNTVKNGSKPVEYALEQYRRQLEVGEQLKQAQVEDKKFKEALTKINNEAAVYLSIGNDIIAAGLNTNEGLWKQFLEMIDLNKDQFTTKEGKWEPNLSADREKQIQEAGNRISEMLEAQIKELEKRQENEKNQDNQKSLNTKIAALKKIQGKILSFLAQQST